MLHVTAPGATADAVVIQDVFLRDIVDLDGDGVRDWLTTPSRDPSDPDVPGYSFVKWRTVVAHFDDAGLALVDRQQHDGVLPWIIPRFREPARRTSRGALYDVSLVRTATNLSLVTRAADGTRGFVAFAP